MLWSHTRGGGFVVALALLICGGWTAGGVLQESWVLRSQTNLPPIMYSGVPDAGKVPSRLMLSLVGIQDAIATKYDGCLDQAPTLTKALTASFISGLGDILAQVHDIRCSHAKSCCKSICWSRLIGVIMDALLISGPLMHAVYSELERLWPTTESFWAPIAHVVVDELFLDAVFVLTFFVFNGIFTGKSVQQVIQNLKAQFFPAFFGAKASSMCFLPLMLYQFRYVPERYRVLVVNLGDIGWYAVTSYFCNLEGQTKPSAPARRGSG